MTTTAPAATLDAPATSTAIAPMRAGLWVLFAAHVIAAWGTQWDVQWHLTVGRDSFWIAPHLMTYAGVTLAFLVSFGVLAWTTLVPDVRTPQMTRIAGLVGTRGYHVAALGMALTVVAAPIDDLWHRLFGIDVTLWSPPHLLGLFGGILNAAAGWLIAREVYAAGTRARLAAIVVAGGFVFGSIGFGLQPGIRMAYSYGGVLFFTYASLAALLAAPTLVITARLSRQRLAPVLALIVVVALGAAGAVVASAGFAWTQPVSFIDEEIAKDPTSPIAISHEIARKNGSRPGAYGPMLAGAALFSALAMAAVDARRRPVLSTLAFSGTMFVVLGVVLARAPAFAQSLPSAVDVALGALATGLAAVASGTVAARLTDAA